MKITISKSNYKGGQNQTLRLYQPTKRIENRIPDLVQVFSEKKMWVEICFIAT